MMIKKIFATACLGGLCVAAMGQGLSTRNFYYDSSQVTNGFSTYIVNGDASNAYLFYGAVPGSAGYNNGIYGASTTNAGFIAQTLINVATYVYISGNFGGVYTVSGIGAAQDTNTYNNDIEVRTNRSLTFTASGFYGIGAGVGQINYTMALFQDYPSNGTQIGPGAFGTDANFNGALVTLPATYALPADGKATLRLSRNLTLTQAALGGHQYVAAGTIQVGVN